MESNCASAFIVVVPSPSSHTYNLRIAYFFRSEKSKSPKKAKYGGSEQSNGISSERWLISVPNLFCNLYFPIDNPSIVWQQFRIQWTEQRLKQFNAGHEYSARHSAPGRGGGTEENSGCQREAALREGKEGV